MLLKLLVSIFLFTTTCINAQRAVVTKPVIDLISAPSSSFNRQLDPYLYYEQIPLSPVNPGQNQAAGPRLHQALFHEIVEIVEETKHEAKVRILNAYHSNKTTGQKMGNFWTLKNNLVPLHKIKNQKLLPTPIDYQNPPANDGQVITLTMPWHCHKNGQIFSAGTRFRVNPQTGYAYCYSQDKNDFIEISIPQHLYLLNEPASPNELRQRFVKLIQKWAHSHQHQSIPYTWGGCSFTQKVPTQRAKARQKKGLNFYTIPHAKPNPYCGLDCTGLVLRAAQAVGIPYFYKNTTTLADALTPVGLKDEIEAGDLIWISGHVIIIAEPDTGNCIEERDYSHGYGKIQKIHISKLFAQTPNLSKLKAAHHSGEPLTRIDKWGNPKGKYQVKIFKLYSSSSGSESVK